MKNNSRVQGLLHVSAKSLWWKESMNPWLSSDQCFSTALWIKFHLDLLKHRTKV